MPVVRLFDNDCRVRLMLDAIGAQEDLEAFNRRESSFLWRGPSAQAAADRERHSLATRRNRAEMRLRHGERWTWNQWRMATPDAREVVRAMLTDLPGKGER